LGIVFTNASAGYWSVNGAPQTTGTTFLQVTPVSHTTSLQTDNTGKITGSGMVEVTYNQAGVPFSVFYVTYGGQISAPAGQPLTATVLIRGSGFTADGTGHATTTLNTLNLKFVGQPGINPLNTNQLRIVGSLTGSVRGATPLSPVAATLPSLQAVIPSSSSNLMSVSTTVVQSQRRMVLLDSGYSGSGSIGVNNDYKFQSLGTDTSRGAIFLFNGVLGPCANVFNQTTNIFSGPISAQFKGKIKGQTVSGVAAPSQINCNLVH
jgi:hypothetical protein